MPPSAFQPPAYRLHKPSGQAVVTLRLPDGRRKDVYLGAYRSKESRAEYARIIAELEAGPAPAAALTGAADLTVNELLVAFWRFAEDYYRRPDGSEGSELATYRLAFKPLRTLYGHTLAREFGPLRLKAVRQQYVNAGLSRSEVNRRARMVRRAFRWAVSEELLPPGVYQSLAAVEGLRKGRTAARESEPVRPVEPADVEAVLPYLPGPVAGMVRLQMLTGMRPGEVCLVRPCDLDTSAPVWVFRPPHHKTAHRGKERAVAVGPQAQAILKAFWPADPEGYFFSPAKAVDALHASRGLARQTPRYPSHMERNRRKRVKARRRGPSDRYTSGSYARAVARGIERANADRAKHYADCGPNLPEVPRWHPNQLRHTHGTFVRRRYGLEAAQVVLGHARADVTQVYAEANLSLAAKVAGEIG